MEKIGDHKIVIDIYENNIGSHENVKINYHDLITVGKAYRALGLRDKEKNILQLREGLTSNNLIPIVYYKTDEKAAEEIIEDPLIAQ